MIISESEENIADVVGLALNLGLGVEEDINGDVVYLNIVSPLAVGYCYREETRSAIARARNAMYNHVDLIILGCDERCPLSSHEIVRSLDDFALQLCKINSLWSSYARLEFLYIDFEASLQEETGQVYLNFVKLRTIS